MYDIQTIRDNNQGTDLSNVESLAHTIATQAPKLKDLSNEQLMQLAKIVTAQKLTDELKEAVNIAGINYNEEKSKFLNVDSAHTRKAYGKALDTLEEYSKVSNINLIALTPAQADDFINSLKGNRAALSVRLTVDACSSFFTFLERRHKAIRNPFRGTKQRPKKKTAKQLNIPTEEEVQAILQSVPDDIKAMFAVLALRGLRIGALPSLRITGNRFTAESKGKSITGEFPDAVIWHIKTSGLDTKQPFNGIESNTLQVRSLYWTKKLQSKGLIRFAYSAHDFRHFYAVTLYQETKDIYRVSKALGHSNIAITQTYLKSLNVMD